MISGRGSLHLPAAASLGANRPANARGDNGNLGEGNCLAAESAEGTLPLILIADAFERQIAAAENVEIRDDPVAAGEPGGVTARPSVQTKRRLRSLGNLTAQVAVGKR